MPTVTTSYERAVNIAPTSGFVNDNIKQFKQSPITENRDEFFEPSPIIIGNTKSWMANATGAINICLHVVCLLTTVIAGFSIVSKDGPMTQYHHTDYIKQIAFVYVICEIAAVVWTLFWYAFVHRAMESAPAATLGLGLQLLSTVSATLLSYWVMMAPKTTTDNSNNDPDVYSADRRPAGMDAVVVVSMYFGWLVIAGYIMTPISGIYLKTK